ncbi:hypothetical protein M4D71_00615 [Niallia taxi]|uniref:hypothetical protein n=1 Tax=Niallia taxi TaxID=2499688 RepID=UPI0021A94492|nr:hypothetical protein [Niallia taxi]MCT2342621.1 hypothetical protein [Niallia taxi]
MRRSEHHQIVEEVANQIMKYAVTHTPLGYERKENQVKEMLSPLARKIKEQQREIKELKEDKSFFLKAYKDKVMNEK